MPLTPTRFWLRLGDAVFCRYQALRKAPQRQRLAEAQWLVEHPEELATEFAMSVAHFASYANPEEHFYPPDRAERKFA